MADYVFVKSMEIVGVDPSKINVIDMVPEDGTAALISGDVAMPCMYGGGAVQAAVEVGSRLVLKATKVDGVYNVDPVNNPNAKTTCGCGSSFST